MPATRLPPPQPAYVLRGHTSQVHALCFAHSNSRLFTGDADGWVVCWSLAYKRPTAVWKAHDNTVLGFALWGADHMITQGRDSRLVVWKLGLAEEAALNQTLPGVNAALDREKPEMIHSLTVNTLNFCSFAWCWDGSGQSTSRDLGQSLERIIGPDSILVAVPNSLDSDGIDVFQLPSEKRISIILADKGIKTGMVMALNIQAHKSKLRIIAGYESGHTIVFAQPHPEAPWQVLYSAQPHSQPVLSLATPPSSNYYLTTSADAIIAKHPLLSTDTAVDPDLKPLKLANTKHAGQQGLSIRSDGKIYATAGWDARVHVYSAKTMKELAVLVWHKEGCYATAFAEVEMLVSTSSADQDSQGLVPANSSIDGAEHEGQSSTNSELTVASASTSLVSQRRDLKAQTTHWLAAGSKDGKVSLWDIF